MSDLLREIRSTQIRAGDRAVCDHLRELGLIAEKVADVQRPLNALKIAAALHDGACPSYVRLDAAEMIRQQHAEIERLTVINSDLTGKSNSYVIENARQAEEIERLTSEREAAIAAAVLAERNSTIEQLREWADELGFDRSSWRWKTPGGLLYRAAEMVSDRTKP